MTPSRISPKEIIKHVCKGLPTKIFHCRTVYIMNLKKETLKHPTTDYRNKMVRTLTVNALINIY